MIKKYIIFLITASVFICCAKIGAPPGGPEDKTPPEVIETVPAQGETFVDTETDVQFIFSEGILLPNPKDGVFITPFPGEEVSYRLSRRRLTIRFSEPLRQNRTIVVTLGTKITDYRRNPMDESYSLAFSTGAVLDQCRISGRVYGERDASGVDVWAYLLTDYESLNPSEIEPDYIVQCSKDGSFQFSHLAPGTYRLFAVRDRLADRLYDPVEDMYGAAFYDVFLDTVEHNIASDIFFQLTREDTILPVISRVFAANNRYIQIQFNKPVIRDDISLNMAAYFVSESFDDTLTVNTLFPDPQRSQVFHVYTNEKIQEKDYDVYLYGWRDESGNPLDTQSERMRFTGNAMPDTLSPELISAIPEPNAKGYSVLYPIELAFNKAMDMLSFSSAFSVEDTNGVSVKGALYWHNPAKASFYPEKHLPGSTALFVRLSGEYALDVSGNALADTAWQFTTCHQDTFSSIGGEILDARPDGAGAVYISAISAEDQDYRKTISISEPGPYVFEGLFPGQYTLFCFRDRNEDGKYSHGSVFPFIPAERFGFSSDTISVASRWSNMGNHLILPWKDESSKKDDDSNESIK